MTDIPSGLAVEGLAVAMAAGNGLAWVMLKADVKGDYRRAAQAGLIYLGLAGPGQAPEPEPPADDGAGF